MSSTAFGFRARGVIASLAFACLLISCNKNSPITLPVKDKTIVFYIVADNDLRYQADCLISDFENLIQKESLNSTYLILLLDLKEDTALLVNNKGRLIRQKNYGKINSLSQEVMSSILDDIRQLFPARENGIIFWSHGSGWLSTGNETRSFGNDSGESMDIHELSESIRNKYDYLIFDACFMGGIEVATELEGKSSYILSAPSSVPLNGIITASDITILVQNSPLESRLVSICESYRNRYEKEDIISPVSLLNVDKLWKLLKSLESIDHIPSSIDLERVLFYEFRGNAVFFDLRMLLSQLTDNCLSVLDEIVLFPWDHSNEECNLSVFVPTKNNVDYWSFYASTRWNSITNWLTKWDITNQISITNKSRD